MLTAQVTNPVTAGALATEQLARTPNPVDTHVGAKIRARRKILGYSQEQLAEALGLTFQQVQKYERGANRVSASKLYETARFLKVPLASFFDGLDEAVTEEVEDPALELTLASGGVELARAYVALGNESRVAVLATARALSSAANRKAA